MCKTVHDEVDIAANPKQVYDAYLDSRTHAKFTGAPARMNRKVGAKFTAGGSYISGFNLDLASPKRIVQAWRGSEWPKGVYSIITLQMKSKGKRTRLIFDQRGIPEDIGSASSKGEWRQFYWEPLVRYFAPPK
jgi:activator of HSP90 ATPase